MLFAFGVAYAGALVRTGSLWATVGLHWGWNIAAFAASDVFGVQTLDTAVSPVISALAHLAALSILLLLSPWMRKKPLLPISNADTRFSSA